MLVTNAQGAVVHRRVLEPFGRVEAETEATEPTATFFTGKRLTSGLGLYDFGARWYDPAAGRLLSIDPIVPSLGDPQSHDP